MRNLFITGLLSVLVVACSHSDKLPPGVLPKQKMRDVMWDMIRSGEFLSGFVFNKDSSIDKIAVSQKWYDKIYQLHKITKTDFDKSYAYYQDHPVLMKEMLDSLGKKQVYERPVPPNAAVARDSAKNKPDSIQRKDSLRRTTDTLRRKMIRKKNLFKAR